ncbi:MAG: diguanylate cyclase [Myxococcota bacterium]|nr:diguanylate cyclase [Myxococcota bacterium]
MTDPSLPVRQPPLSSVATKIIAVVFGATFLTALAVSWISVHSTYTFLRRQVERSFPALLAGTGERLDGWLEHGRDALAAQATRWPDVSSAAAEARLARLDADLPAFEVLVWLDAEGAVRAASGRLPGGLLATPPLQAGRPVLDAAPLADGPRPRAVAPLPDGAGALVGLFDRGALAERLAPPGLGEDAALVLAAAPPAALSAPDGVDVYRDGEQRFVVGAARPLAARGVHLVLEQPFRQAFEPVFSVVARVFVVDLGIILLFSWVAYQITTAIVRPIEALSHGARRISQGELGVEVAENDGNDELSLLTRTFNDMTRKLRRHQNEIQAAHAELRSQYEELERANEVLEQLSITDGLTKLHNHRFFQDILTREIKRVSRTGDPLAILLIDIDDFKRLNDRLGHAAGDELLSGIARILNDSIRESDFVARYGGEEFVVLAPDTDRAGALRLAEKIRTAIAESSFILDESMQLTKMTVSIGVATYRGNRKAFFQAADQALYRAKDGGKNCVACEDEGPLGG